MAAAISRARPRRSACGTTSLTRPAVSAWSAGRKSPVKLIWRARDRPTASGSRTDRPQPGSTPTRAWVSAKTARSEQMTMSQLSTSSSPPVTAAPFTAAITGLLTGAHGPVPPDAAPRRTDACWPISFRSTPAQKAGSVPVRMTDRTSSSASTVAIAPPSRVSSSPLIALRDAGRLSVIVAIAPSTSSNTTASVMRALLEGGVGVRVAVARQAEDPLADDVALDLAGAPGDAQDLAGQERLGSRGRVPVGRVPGDRVAGLGLGGEQAEGHLELGVGELADRPLGPWF